MTSPIRSLPNFLIIGAQKSGTSSLYKYLSKHPQVMPAIKKEVHFFDLQFERGINWYRSHFPISMKLDMKGAITGEASPYYLYHPCAPRRIASVLPNAKLIVLLRDPVDRAISHYWHEVNRTNAESLNMVKAFKQEEKRLRGEKEKIIDNKDYYSYEHQHYSYKERGKYIQQIKGYMRYFSRESIKIVKSEKLFDNTQEILNDISDFLEIGRAKIGDTEPRVTGKYDHEKDSEARIYLRRYFRKYNKQLNSQFGVRFD